MVYMHGSVMTEVFENALKAKIESFSYNLVEDTTILNLKIELDNESLSKIIDLLSSHKKDK